jgi:hypothetical protein
MRRLVDDNGGGLWMRTLLHSVRFFNRASSAAIVQIFSPRSWIWRAYFSIYGMVVLRKQY